MIEVKYNVSRSKTVAYRLPECWNDCTFNQVKGLAHMLESGFDLQAAKVEACRILLNRGYEFYYLFFNTDLEARILPYFSWVFNENTLTHQLLPHYRGFYGPKDRLANIVMKEFHATEMYYRMMLDKVPNALDMLIGVLYRPAKEDYNRMLDAEGDIRQAYNGNTVNYRAGIINKWPGAVKKSILLYYDGCRQFIIKKYSDIFSGSDITTEEQYQGMFLLMRGLADDGKFGIFREIEELPVYTALTEVALLCKEHKAVRDKISSL